MNRSNSGKRWLATMGLVFFTLAVGASAISQQSFWMDEGNAIVKAMMPTISEMWNFSKHLGGSEIQMPAFMLALWGWEKVAGNSEYLLRLINLPFLLVMVLSLRRYRFWPLVCLTSPFVLYYVGELRPYMIQMAAAAVGLSALIRMLEQKEDSDNLRGLHALIASALFMAVTSLTAAVWSGGLFLGLLIGRAALLRKPGFWRVIAIWSIPVLIAAGYYVYTLLQGYRGANDRGGSLLSIGFGIYELIGMMGLGPGKDEMRGITIAGLLTNYPWLPLVALTMFAAWCFGLKHLFTTYGTRARIALALAAAAPVSIFAGVGIFAHFSVLGRHMAPLIPFLLLPLACACDAALKQKRWLPLAVAPIVFGIVSAVVMRISTIHMRDDYRTATDLVMKDLSKGRSVLWEADMNAPRYYAFRNGGMPAINYIQQLESNRPSGFMFADVIYINRPDLRYGGTDHHATLIREGFEQGKGIVGFEIWRNRYSDLQ